MKILHVLSQFEVTGAETYAATLANRQVTDGHTVFIVSDTFQTPTRATYFPHPIGVRKFSQRLRNIRYLRELIRQEGIDVVHAHSRAASWVSWFAVRGTRVPLISTIHGRQHIHFSSKSWDMYGDRVIAVCDNLRTHLIAELGLSPSKVIMIPNAIHWGDFSESQVPSAPHLMVVGRTTGPKGRRTGDLIQSVFPKLLEKHSDLRITVMGGDPQHLPEFAKLAWENLETRFPGRVRLLGFVKSLESYLREATGVIASGRIAMEAIRLGIPVFALGEGRAEGWVTPENFAKVMASNFGDCVAHAQEVSPLNPNEEELYPVPKFSLQHHNLLQTRLAETYGVDSVYPKIMEFYASARMRKFHPQWIPNLMFHKVPEAPLAGPHRIFVVKKQFERHLFQLKRLGFSTLTFQDYEDFATGRRSLEDFPKKPIFITFDDGYQDTVDHALPLLTKYGFRATVFLLGDRNVRSNIWDDGADPLMNATGVKSLVQSGMEIGAHGMSHTDFSNLDSVSLKREIAACLDQLEKETGNRPIVFAYPFGTWSESAKAMLQSCGVKYAVSTSTGGLTLEDDRLAIFRVNIFPEDGRLQIWKKTRSSYRLRFANRSRHN